MRYWVYWNYGSCNDGDHNHGIVPFESLESARNRVKELESNSMFNWNGYALIISGELAEEDGTEIPIQESKGD